VTLETLGYTLHFVVSKAKFLQVWREVDNARNLVVSQVEYGQVVERLHHIVDLFNLHSLEVKRLKEEGEVEVVANVFLRADLLENSPKLDGLTAEFGQGLLIRTELVVFELSSLNHQVDPGQAVFEAGTDVTLCSWVPNVIQMSDSNLLADEKMEII
jgi:hypothetical protein